MANALAELVAAIAAIEKWTHAGRGAAFELTVPQAKGRSQSVRVETFEHEGEPLVRFTTTVGARAELSPSRYEKALELNQHLPYGRLALDGGNLVITDTRPLRTTTPETSGRVIRFIAHQADLYERVIYRQDVH